MKHHPKGRAAKGQEAARQRREARIVRNLIEQAARGEKPSRTRANTKPDRIDRALRADD